MQNADGLESWPGAKYGRCTVVAFLPFRRDLGGPVKVMPRPIGSELGRRHSTLKQGKTPFRNSGGCVHGFGSFLYIWY